MVISSTPIPYRIRTGLLSDRPITLSSGELFYATDINTMFVYDSVTGWSSFGNMTKAVFDSDGDGILSTDVTEADMTKSIYDPDGDGFVRTRPISAQTIIGARNKIGPTTEVEAQTWIDAHGDVIHTDGVMNRWRASAVLRHSHDAVASTGSTAWAKLKTIHITTAPVINQFRVYFELRGTTHARASRGKIYRNGVVVGTSQMNHLTTWTSFTEDLVFNSGDMIELWGRVDFAGDTTFVQNFRLKVSYSPSSLAEGISLNDVGVPTPTFAGANTTP